MTQPDWNTEISGELGTGDLDLVCSLILAWCGAHRLSAGIGQVGGEVVWRRDGHYVYASEYRGGSFLVEGHTSRTGDETRAWLAELAEICRARGVAAELYYMPLDPRGVEFSTEHRVP